MGKGRSKTWLLIVSSGTFFRKNCLTCVLHLQPSLHEKFQCFSMRGICRNPQWYFFFCLFVSAGLEFAYSQAPEYLKGVIMALFLSASGIGSYIANFVVAIVSSDWYPEKDPNQGHMEYFFFMMASLMTLNFLLFLFIASSYKYKESSSQSEETEEDQDAHELTISVSSVHGWVTCVNFLLNVQKLWCAPVM